MQWLRKYRIRNWLAMGIVLLPIMATAQFTPYSARTEFLPTTPGTSPTGLLGYVNPAILGGLTASENAVAWSAGRAGSLISNDWGLYSALPHLGFGMVRRHGGGARYNEYRLGLGGGDESAKIGMSWGWSSGNGAPDPVWITGVLLRPGKSWSLGSTWTSTFDGDSRELAGDLGWRPFASPRLTLFAEGARGWDTGDNSYWTAGLDLRLWSGLHVSGRHVDGGAVELGVRMEFGAAGLWARGQRDTRRNRHYNRSLNLLRLGPHRGDLVAPLQPTRKAFLQLDLQGPVRHRNYPLFDDGRSLLSLLETLQHVVEDPDLAGVAINLSGLRLDAAMSWELRQKLQAIRDAGRRVVVYIDRADLRRYHLASVADVIVLDPQGLIVLQGVAAGQVYLKGALDKLGIGSQEWRYHEYKSALESLNRTSMSDKDREQWQALLEDDYGRAQYDISVARGLTAAAFDSLVNEVTGLLPTGAMAAGLVDSVGRWETVERVVALQGGTGGLLDPAQLTHTVSESWGAAPEIAVVYALGICAMDTGIRARALATQLRDLAEDNSIAAVVLRVDSPGGDALASDLVADAVVACRARKPVIVSQARLAASGGYWISMESDAIVATPATITGSIGVIGGWLYNQGFRERLGVTVDHVQIGEHADLGLGLPLPLIGTPLPERALTEEEVQRTDRVLSVLYDDFVTRVASARKRTPAEIDAVARGRVWAGTAAMEQGLVDELGGLETAIQLARKHAGIAADQPVQISEWPRLAWFSLRDFPGLIRTGLSPPAQNRQPAWYSCLQFRLEHNGQPLLLLPEPLLQSDRGGLNLGRYR